MSDLVAMQHRFAVSIAKLILYADEIGLTITLGDAYRDPRLHGQLGEKKGYGAANSCHKIRLAVDINIIKDGQLAGEEEHRKLHQFWDSIGGSKLIPDDMNHYSFEYKGYR